MARVHLDLLKRQRLAVFFFTILGTLGAPQYLTAQISPGPLSKGHANLEGISHCTQCHEAGNAISASKCLTCHNEIGDQRANKHGYHFANATSPCQECHTEHVGIDATITRFEESTFDHRRTGFVLTGKHASISCADCHAEKNIKNTAVLALLKKSPHKTMLGLSQQCNSCHTDKHNGTLGTQCQSCHGTNSWSSPATFDHDKTKFALAGKHKQVKCSLCHEQASLVSANRPVLFATKSFDDCTPCHASPHGRQFKGQTCRSCHTAEGWSIVVTFNHATTRFQLLGKHATVPCEACHTQMKKAKEGVVSFATKAFEDCTPCHTTPHNPKFAGRKCSSCHVPDSWGEGTATQFNHSLTNYALEGKHKQVPCNKCHQESKGSTFKARFLLTFSRCTDCHTDYHDGQFQARYDSNCAACHTVQGFTPSTFSVARHDSTLFPLNGAHVATPCSGCHIPTGAQKPHFRFTNFRCQACHEDIHKGQFAKELARHSCAACHSTSKWTAIFFDHAGTKFPLIGKHTTVECSGCHRERIVDGVKRVQYTGLPLHCQGCHKDVHENQFASSGQTRCEECHSPADWHALLFNHETQSSFHLTGAHKNVPCSGCHKTESSTAGKFVRYKPMSSKCESCHKGSEKSMTD